MSHCELLSDRIPLVALGRASWSPEEAAHLESCAECRAEWTLVRTTASLGVRAPAPADPAAVASALERRLARDRFERRRRRLGWSLTGLAAAAAVAVAVWTGAPRPSTGAVSGAPEVAAEALVPLPELESLETAELDSLLDRMEAPMAGGSTLGAPTLGELEDHELERVLATWEG